MSPSLPPPDASNRVAVVEAALDDWLAHAQPAQRLLAPDEPLRPGSTLVARQALELFEDQLTSRALDVIARELKKSGRSYYTISSAGHEQNACLGAQLELSDPCFLHYRSGALMMARQRKQPGSTPVFDTLLSLCASAEDPVSNGRHKVWGSRELWVPPQTSTIASHLPTALGAAFAMGRARRIGVGAPLPQDAIVMCSFGDASLNHATALAGINSARYSLRRGNPTPVLFVCEDNKRGISVDKPRRWISDTVANLSQITYVEARGELDQIWDAVGHAIRTCRTLHRPVFLRLDCVRLWGHAGSDVETGYRSLEQIEEVEERDPLLSNAKRLVETGAATPSDLAALVKHTRERVAAAAEEAAERKKLESRVSVMAPLAPHDEAVVRAEAEGALPEAERRELFGARLPEERTSDGQRTLAAQINAALHDLMLRVPETLARTYGRLSELAT